MSKEMAEIKYKYARGKDECDEGLQFDFSVIIFTNTDEAEAVPSSWLCCNNTQCKWPPKSVKNTTTLIKSKSCPQRDWMLHPVTLVKQYGSYVDALRKVRKITEKGDGTSHTSEESNDELVGKGHRKKFPTLKIISEDESEIYYVPPSHEIAEQLHVPEENILNVSHTIRRGPQVPVDSNLLHSQPETVTEADTSLKNLLPVDLTFLESDYMDLQKKIDGLAKSQDLILREMCKITIEMQEVKKAILYINSTHVEQRSQDEPEGGIEFHFPLKTREEFDEFNELLKNETLKKSFIGKMKLLRNNKVGIFVRAILENVLSPNLSKQLAWTSAKNNIPIADTSLVILTREIIRKFCDSDCTDKVFKESVCNWLKNANYRVKKEQKKLEQTENP